MNDTATTKSYHHGNLRAELLSTAIAQLRETGVDDLSLRALARAVGVSQTAPYRHFADKGELLAAMATQGYRDLLQDLTDAGATADDAFDDGRLRVDRSRHLVERDGRAIHLTKKEFDLLWLLIKSGGRVVSRETILSRLWDYAADVETRTVDVHIRSLRKKIGDDVVETVVGVGYRFPT